MQQEPRRTQLLPGVLEGGRGRRQHGEAGKVVQTGSRGVTHGGSRGGEAGAEGSELSPTVKVSSSSVPPSGP